MKFIIFITIILVSIFIYNWKSIDISQEENSIIRVSSEALKDNIKESKNPSLINIQQTVFDKMSIEQKTEIYLRCNDYFHAYDNEIDLLETYYENYKEANAGKDPTKKQLQAFDRRLEKCRAMIEFQDDLKEVLLNSPFIDQETGKNIYFLELENKLKNYGSKVSIQTAKENLLNKEAYIRDASIKFLMKEDEINRINQEADVPKLEKYENQGLFYLAVDLRKCELGLIDCSSDSYSALIACQSFSENCNMELQGIMLFSLTGFEISYVEKYLQYLRSLN